MLNKNYFELFDLTVTYMLDIEDLAQRYRRLQQAVHPDRYANASALEKRIAMQQATHVNSAYQALKLPLARGLYLLELAGHAVDEHSSSNSIMDQGFLFEQMDLRESLEKIPKSADPFEKLNHFIAKLEQLKDNLYKKFKQVLDDQQWSDAQEIARKLQFYDKLHEECLSLEERLFTLD